jgi:hypothetical protein
MAEHELAKLEQDPRFPGGPWTGFFLQYWFPGRHPTNMRLSFRDGELTGTGQDWVGAYSIDGSYDLVTCQCEWTKQYFGIHAVSYRGINDGHGIRGVWEIRILGGLYVDRGGFHIWPEGTDVSEESDLTEQAVVAMMRKEFGTWRYRTIRGLIFLLFMGAGIALTLLLLGIWKY